MVKTVHQPVADINSVATLIAAILLMCAGASMFQVEPLFLGAAAVAMGLDGAQIGLLAGAELIGAALGSVAAFFWVSHFNWRYVATGALLVLAAGNLYSATIDDLNLLMAVRCATGFFGSGTVYAVALAIIGDMRNPDRAFGIAIAILVGLTMVALFLLPGAIVSWGPAGVLVPLAAFALLIIPVVLRIPACVSATESETTSQSTSSVLAVMLALTVQVVWYIGVGGVWAFIERIGTASNIELSSIGGALAIGMGAGAAGAILASAIGTRWGRLPMFALAMLAQAVSLYVLTTELDWSSFLLAATLFNVSWNFALPFLLGAIAARDPSGRFTVLIVAAQGLGVAIGPIMAGFLIEGMGLSSVSYFGISACALSVLLFIVISRSRVHADVVASGTVD